MTERAGPLLRRGLGLLDATTIVAGAVIGTGIFLVPSLVARQVGAPGLSLAVWLVCGFLALSGALCFAELGGAIPRTGGTYAFLYRAFRTPLLPFLFGWSMFFVVLTGVMAAVATAFAIYAGFFLEGVIPYGVWTRRLVAIGCILFLTAMNCIGVRVGGRIQVLFAIVKVGALLVIIAVGFLLGDVGRAGGGGDLAPLLPSGRPAGDVVGAFGTAMIVALFAYNGWWYTTFVAGELRNPRRTIPRSIFFGMGIVLVLYVLANIVYLAVLPFDALQASARPAADTMARLLGPGGAALISAAVMLSAFGTVNAQMLSIPRIYFAMARDGLFFRRLARVHPRFRTPATAILAQGLWASGFALTGTYQEIITYTAFPNYFFLSLAVLGLIVLRVREPDLPRPYRVWAYPLTPVLFLLIFAWYLVNSLLNAFADTMVGVLLTGFGIPFYFYWARNRDGGAGT
ncbi:MAG: amino acid permease, partial [Longimicrobiales bacterium]